eukprot:4977247-Amphidinium_carterae.1
MPLSGRTLAGSANALCVRFVATSVACGLLLCAVCLTQELHEMKAALKVAEMKSRPQQAAGMLVRWLTNLFLAA